MDESKPAPASVSQSMGASVGVTNPEPASVPVATGMRVAGSVLLDYVHRVAMGDQQALAALYDETSRLVYSLSLRILGNPADAEEVTLDVYTQVWRSAATFDGERGSAIAWLMTIARSRAIDRQRTSANRSRREEPLSDFIEPVAARAGQPTVTFGLERTVRKALAALDPEQREPIELAYFFRVQSRGTRGEAGAAAGND